MSRAGDINIRREATISFAGSLVDTAVSFLGLIAMAYILGAAGLGRYYFVLSVVTVSLFPVMGLGQAVIKRGSEVSHDPSQVFGTGLSISLVYALLVVAGLGIVTVTDVVTIRFGSDVIVAAAAVFGVRTVLTIQLDSYRSRGHTALAQLTDNAYGILETALQLGVLAMGFEIFGLLAASAVATLMTIVAHAVFSSLDVSPPSVSVGRSLLTYGRWSITSAAISTLYERLPVLVLGFVGMDAAIGYYTSSKRLLILGSYVGGSIAPALLAKTSSKESGATETEMFEEFRNVHHHVTVLAVALAFGSYALPGPLMATFFDMSDPLAGAALMGLTLFFVIQSLVRTEYTFLNGLDMPEFGVKTGAITLAVQVVLIPILFHFYGFLGIVAAVVLAQFTGLVVTQAIFWRLFETVPLPGGLVQQCVSGVVMFLVIELITTVVHVTSAVRLLAIIAVGAIVYVTVLALVDTGFREAMGTTVAEVRAAL